MQGSGTAGVTAVVVDGVHELSGTNGVGVNNIYKNNSFHDFQNPASCGLTVTGAGYYEWDGIHCDVGPQNSTIDSNVFSHIDPARVHAGSGIGVHIEYGCMGWVVKNNVIHDIGSNGILDNQRTTGARALYYNNTIYNILDSGIEIRWGYATVENNIISNAKQQIAVRGTAVNTNPGTWTVDYNTYWDNSGGTHVGWYNEGAGQEPFATWKANCACDSHSINANPLFVNQGTSDFYLQPTSPVINIGATLTAVSLDTDGVSRPQGSAYDIGAYEWHP